MVTTTDSDEEADAIAESLVRQQLAACVQRTRITSHYMWEGDYEKSDEILILIKTRSDKVDAIKRFIEENHSYDTPELIEVPIVSGLAGYLGWMDEVVR
ncbi:MAG TPA: divalent-cation tolerance protein CutA [Actinomycetota bacterium]|nr:divalent-cation tolerance protein CutA [Actinomycetota bacterium]